MNLSRPADGEQVLAVRRFTLADQLRFAALSGDHNPIHVDPIAARRSISGACIVHGVHGVLWALQAVGAATGATAVGFKARFLKPIFLDEPVTAVWNPNAQRISLRSAAGVLATVGLTTGGVEPAAYDGRARDASLAAPEDPSFEDCANTSERPFLLRGNPALAAELLAPLCATYGTLAVNEIATLSTIVGMERPGLNSLFTALRVRLRAAPAVVPRYRVAGSDARFRLLNIEVEGLALEASIEAFYRPPPARGPTAMALSANVARDEFRGVRALVVGGSRGLGEWVAKALAAGGGRVLVSYRVGRAEAERVVDEIRAAGGTADCVCWTAGEGVDPPDAGALSAFNQVYYFATPRIRVERPGAAAGDAGVTGVSEVSEVCAYDAIYVDAFAELAAALARRGAGCALFYPSTVFIDSHPPEFARYVAAKQRGEALCARLNTDGPLRVLAARLPRLPTDQTLGFAAEAFEDPLEVLLPWLRAMPVFAAL